MICDFLQLATEGVRGLQPYQPGKPVEALERELGLCDIIKLASNENPLGPGSKAKAVIASSMENLSRYPDGNGVALKSVLAERLHVPQEALTLGNGSNEVLELLVRAFATPAHEVIYSQHSFAVYALATQAVGARAVVTAASEWGHDLAAMAASVTERTRVMFIANPNNPTGTWLNESQLRQLLGATPSHVLVVVDEAYAEYVVDENYPDCRTWVSQYSNLVVTRTFSKVHGLAGLRVGYSLSDPGVAEILNRVRQPFNVNSVAQAAAAAALVDTEHVARSVVHNRAELSHLTAAFDRMGLDFVPSVANFVAVDLGRPSNTVYEALLREGVIVRPMGSYGMPNHLRVTVGLEGENARFLTALNKVLAGSHS